MATATASGQEQPPPPNCRHQEVEVAMVPCLSDNYGFLLYHKASGKTAAVDTPDASKLLNALAERPGWAPLDAIFNTHHHADHCGGNIELKEAFPACQVYGPVGEREKISGGVDVAVGGGDSFEWGGQTVQVIDVGGHTKGHVAYYLSKDRAAFVGDSLFALGCGRLFEGTPEQAWASLERLMELEDDTQVYCAHEYTGANAKFAETIEGRDMNPALAARLDQIAVTLSNNLPTVPTTIGLERRTNPFVRPTQVREALGLPSSTPDHEVFAEVRRRKDSF
jgi:hydroxyacylglutathione hydrolase